MWYDKRGWHTYYYKSQVAAERAASKHGVKAVEVTA